MDRKPGLHEVLGEPKVTLPDSHPGIITIEFPQAPDDLTLRLLQAIRSGQFQNYHAADMDCGAILPLVNMADYLGDDFPPPPEGFRLTEGPNHDQPWLTFYSKDKPRLELYTWSMATQPRYLRRVLTPFMSQPAVEQVIKLLNP